MSAWSSTKSVQGYGCCSRDGVPCKQAGCTPGLGLTQLTSRAWQRWQKVHHQNIWCVHFRSLLTNTHIHTRTPDFGMSRMVNKEYYKSESTVIPVRWCAPEVLQFGKYSTSSGICKKVLFHTALLTFPARHMGIRRGAVGDFLVRWGNSVATQAGLTCSTHTPDSIRRDVQH